MNIQHTWPTIKDILNKCKDKKEFPAFLILNGEKIEDINEISNTFNNCFASVGAKLQIALNTMVPKNLFPFETKGFISAFDFECISTPADVDKIVKNLASKNSSGHDGISACFLKRILETVTFIAINSYHQPILLYWDLS